MSRQPDKHKINHSQKRERNVVRTGHRPYVGYEANSSACSANGPRLKEFDNEIITNIRTNPATQSETDQIELEDKLIRQCRINGKDMVDTEEIHPYNNHKKRNRNICDTRKNMNVCPDDSILRLPDDMLFVILSFLNKSDLRKLCVLCKRFYHICSKDSVWLNHYKRTVLHLHSDVSSSKKRYSNKDLCRIAHNWENGKFWFSFKAKQRTRLIPWLQKDENVVWFSSGNVIRCFHYLPRTNGWREYEMRTLQGMHKDATRFSVKHNMLASGCRDGSVHLWETNKQEPSHVICQNASPNQVLCVDLTDQVVMSGSKDGTCTVTRINALRNSISFAAGEKVWSLKASPCGQFFVAGLSGYLNSPPLIMWDVESGTFLGSLGSHHRHGAGILDIKFESQHELLTCGYDTILRLWDLRCPAHKCVAHWTDPFDSTLYSIASMGGNAISVGTARHGLVRLWDKRSKKHVQFFYSQRCHSPVYSLAMDQSHLFLALDVGFSTMDFSIRR